MKRAHLLVLGLLLTGCSLPLTRQIQERHQAGQWLARAEETVRAGRYQEAEDTYQRLLEGHPSAPPADRARFGLARLHTLPENPNRDYQQAYQHFDRLLREFPDSQWADEARAWRELLAALLAQREEVADAHRRMERLREQAEHALREIDRVRKDVERERRRHREEVAQTRREVERTRREAERVQQDLERLKTMEVELERQSRR